MAKTKCTAAAAAAAANTNCSKCSAWPKDARKKKQQQYSRTAAESMRDRTECERAGERVSELVEAAAS